MGGHKCYQQPTERGEVLHLVAVFAVPAALISIEVAPALKEEDEELMYGKPPGDLVQVGVSIS